MPRWSVCIILLSARHREANNDKQPLDYSLRGFSFMFDFPLAILLIKEAERKADDARFI